jgi:hypothetical protein
MRNGVIWLESRHGWRGTSVPEGLVRRLSRWVVLGWGVWWGEVVCLLCEFETVSGLLIRC